MSYQIKISARLANGKCEWMVVRDDGVRCFFGTKSECAGWIERNGHDDWN